MSNYANPIHTRMFLDTATRTPIVVGDNPRSGVGPLKPEGGTVAALRRKFAAMDVPGPVKPAEDKYTRTVKSLKTVDNGLGKIRQSIANQPLKAVGEEVVRPTGEAVKLRQNSLESLGNASPRCNDSEGTRIAVSSESGAPLPGAVPVATEDSKAPQPAVAERLEPAAVPQQTRTPTRMALERFLYGDDTEELQKPRGPWAQITAARVRRWQVPRQGGVRNLASRWDARAASGAVMPHSNTPMPAGHRLESATTPCLDEPSVVPQTVSEGPAPAPIETTSAELEEAPQASVHVAAPLAPSESVPPEEPITSAASSLQLIEPLVPIEVGDDSANALAAQNVVLDVLVETEVGSPAPASVVEAAPKLVLTEVVPIEQSAGIAPPESSLELAERSLSLGDNDGSTTTSTTEDVVPGANVETEEGSPVVVEQVERRLEQTASKEDQQRPSCDAEPSLAALAETDQPKPSARLRAWPKLDFPLLAYDSPLAALRRDFLRTFGPPSSSCSGASCSCRIPDLTLEELSIVPFGDVPDLAVSTKAPTSMSIASQLDSREAVLGLQVEEEEREDDDEAHLVSTAPTSSITLLFSRVQVRLESPSTTFEFPELEPTESSIKREVEEPSVGFEVREPARIDPDGSSTELALMAPWRPPSISDLRQQVEALTVAWMEPPLAAEGAPCDAESLAVVSHVRPQPFVEDAVHTEDGSEYEDRAGLSESDFDASFDTASKSFWEDLHSLSPSPTTSSLYLPATPSLDNDDTNSWSPSSSPASTGPPTPFGNDCRAACGAPCSQCVSKVAICLAPLPALPPLYTCFDSIDSIINLYLYDDESVDAAVSEQACSKPAPLPCIPSWVRDGDLKATASSSSQETIASLFKRGDDALSGLGLNIFVEEDDDVCPLPGHFDLRRTDQPLPVGQPVGLWGWLKRVTFLALGKGTVEQPEP